MTAAWRTLAPAPCTELETISPAWKIAFEEIINKMLIMYLRKKENDFEIEILIISNISISQKNHRVTIPKTLPVSRFKIVTNSQSRENLNFFQ